MDDRGLAAVVISFAAAVVRADGEWSAAPVCLADVVDAEDVVDRLRDAEPAADVALLFVESDDTYLTIVRLDEGDELRVFSSDAAFAGESRVGALLLGEDPRSSVEIDASLTTPAPTSPEADPTRGVADPGDPALVEPAGDPALLDDLGVPAARLLELCAHKDLLPSDVTAEVCMAIGAGDDVEELREA